MTRRRWAWAIKFFLNGGKLTGKVIQRWRRMRAGLQEQRRRDEEMTGR